MKSIYNTLQERFISESARHVGERVVVTAPPPNRDNARWPDVGFEKAIS